MPIRTFSGIALQCSAMKRWANDFLLVLLVILCFPFSSSASDVREVEQHLRAQHKQKIYILRRFYSGNSLHFDGSGHALDQAVLGDWTVNGVVQVNDVEISGESLKISATRLHLGWIGGAGLQVVHDQDGNGKPDKDEKKNRELNIEVDMGRGSISEAAAVAFSRIFLSSADSFAELVPDYWKRCVRSAVQVPLVGTITEKSKNSCQFSSEFLDVPGVASMKESTSEEPSNGSVFPVGPGITPPRVILSPEPEFSPYARKAKFQGTATLSFVVSKEGLPTNIQIVNPIGCGLDEQAVLVVAKWKFEPAKREGQPVAVEIAVDIDFHLY